jgi:lauroyl/myristoyl acyltransferase
VRTRALLVLLELAAALARVLPRASGRPLGLIAGAVWYLGATKTREAVHDNLQHVLGRPPSAREVRAVFQHGAMNYWDTLVIPRLSRADIEAFVHVRGLEHLDAALRLGRGALLVGGHIGSIALAIQALSVRGYRVTCVVEEIKPRELLEFWKKRRQALGLEIVFTNGLAARTLLAALRRGEVVALVTDRDVTGTGPRVLFFGVETTFAEGAAALALRTGAPILPATAWRLPDGSVQAVIEPPMSLPTTGHGPAARVELTQAIARRLEYHIKGHPEQWTVFQQRWLEA